MDPSRPRVYTLAQAAERIGVTERTIQRWQLRPLPGALETLGYHLYTEPDLVAAELVHQRGRRNRLVSAPP